jgi:mannose/cellobiose epimerase-like protein (N-acyl-D-glucosamine 2-epimerase family)
MLEPSALDQILIDVGKIYRAQAYDFMDRMIAAKDVATGLLPLHIRMEHGKLVALDHVASGLDMGRTTAGLVMLSRLAVDEGDRVRADRYIKAAEENYDRGKELLANGDYFVHQQDFDDQGNPTKIAIGEPGKSASGEDNMSRVNPRAYAFRAASELYIATGKEDYRTDLERYFSAWIRDFHDPANGGFFIHGNITDPSDHKEIDSFQDPSGIDSKYDGRQGIKGNDGTIYALSSILLQANEILGTQQTQKLVKEQLDIILRKFHRQNGMLWENYTNDWMPISVGWQNQAMDTPEGQSAKTSHVAIGGHTAMAPQQIIEGARQLLKQGKISQAEYASYIDGALSLFQEFATKSGAIDWSTGAVHNGIRVEEPRLEHRWLQAWGDAGWQQAELLQTLLRFREEQRLQDIKGSDGKTSEELLKLAETHYVETYHLPEAYSFDGFGNPDVYHRPQLAFYHPIFPRKT